MYNVGSSKIYICDKTLLRVVIKEDMSTDRGLDDESDNILLFKQWKDQENC